MAFDAHVLLTLIASPGDTAEERDAVERALHSWNADRAIREQVILLPRRWENSAVPRLGGRGQGVINEQLVDDVDIVIALFDSRLGMATGEAVSGTAEEIQRAHEAGKPVHVWFSEEPIPRDADLDQVRALQEFKAALQPLGLLGKYASPDDLAFKVRQAVESDLAALSLDPSTTRRVTPTAAILRARYESDREPHVDNRGRTKYRTRRERLTIRNVGGTAASEVHPELRAVGEGAPPQLWGDEAPTILPESEFSWPITSSSGTTRVVEVVMTWTENSVERVESQHVSM
jgi:hypothetical protein